MVELVEMVEVCVGFGFMLPRTEVLARLMVGPVIRHCLQCRMSVPTIRLKKITPASRPVLMQCRHPPPRTSVVFFFDGGVGRSEMKKYRRRFGFRGKARLSDCVSEASVVGLRRESAVGWRMERLWHVGALSGTETRAGKRSGSLLSCV